MNIAEIRKRLDELTAARDEIEVEMRVLKNLLHSKTKRQQNLTAERLREVLSYDPETGYFFWKEHRDKRRIGERAGPVGDGTYYRSIAIDGTQFFEQRLAWLYVTGEWPLFIVDHKNEDKTDNRFENLRDVNWSVNNLRKTLHPKNTTGRTGVSLHQSGRYRASLYHNGRQVYHKLFATVDEAGDAYDEQWNIYHGHHEELD
jgi:hypothetical protein